MRTKQSLGITFKTFSAAAAPTFSKVSMLNKSPFKIF